MVHNEEPSSATTALDHDRFFSSNLESETSSKNAQVFLCKSLGGCSGL